METHRSHAHHSENLESGEQLRLIQEELEARGGGLRGWSFFAVEFAGMPQIRIA